MVASSLTPQSTPIDCPVAGKGSICAGTTKEAYQWPRLSRYTRTDDGAAGSSRDHSTLAAMPPANSRRPSLGRNPRRV
ncbi:hypothetical protein [Actinomadura darangshiensis]|uniref:hypothetical protein n=1 Tax=Actinomadura darangshiensis TaxID=705336 RepID=UPI001A9D24BD|nr:hypothetical protein [Actinomadura darangshiensis]